MRKRELARLIDHTVLGPATDRAAVERVCEEAARYGFWAACVPAPYVALARKLLRDTGVKVCTVVGFPHGQHKPEVKAFEAKQAVDDGADEVDMVINVAGLMDGDYPYVLSDIRAVREVLDKAPRPVVLKVILECALLSDEQKEAGAILAKAAGADFVKTSTGFGPGGATREDVALLRRVVGQRMGVKAAGGIRDWQTALQMIEAGANRIGTSKGPQVIEGAPE
ncbi:MAG: Deoxyribose-phosphate aldolase [Acetothermia bacterium 64_32]|nr:MAG: Deoxyribose-phosphate aldolase [Acetothermia bacterium 64_32]HAF70714.1 deoxyribose-phosphate aldolase [Candidatus Acetothermia bacterium]